ncbi:hypothetical protein D3C86_1198750 [compost metagenome]
MRVAETKPSLSSLRLVSRSFFWNFIDSLARMIWARSATISSATFSRCERSSRTCPTSASRRASNSARSLSSCAARRGSAAAVSTTSGGKAIARAMVCSASSRARLARSVLTRWSSRLLSASTETSPSTSKGSPCRTCWPSRTRTSRTMPPSACCTGRRFRSTFTWACATTADDSGAKLSHAAAGSSPQTSTARPQCVRRRISRTWSASGSLAAIACAA